MALRCMVWLANPEHWGSCPSRSSARLPVREALPRLTPCCCSATRITRPFAMARSSAAGPLSGIEPPNDTSHGEARRHLRHEPVRLLIGAPGDDDVTTVAMVVICRVGRRDTRAPSAGSEPCDCTVMIRVLARHCGGQTGLPTRCPIRNCRRISRPRNPSHPLNFPPRTYGVALPDPILADGRWRMRASRANQSHDGPLQQGSAQPEMPQDRHLT